MKKNLMAFILFAALLAALPVTGAAAKKGTTDNFVEILPYEDQFTDVPADAWYASVVAKAYSYGLIVGIGENRFDPDGSLTVAEAVTMADRIHSIYYTGAQDFAESDPWYATYIDYALENGILSEVPANCDEAVTRARFISVLARSLPTEALPVISSIEDNSIPDVASDSPFYDDFYLLYRAGVLVGSDELGSARPDDPITRAEASVVLTHMADRSERQSITLTAIVTLYAEDGRTIVVTAGEVAAYQAAGWYRYPVARVYLGSISKVIPEKEKADYLRLGWFAEPVVALPSDLSALNKTVTLPVISITADGPIDSHDDYTSCTVSVFNVKEDMALSEVSGGIRLRGNSSAAAVPPPYRIKFDKKQNLLGLNNGAKMKSWVLLTSTDSLISDVKNDIAFRFGRALLGPDGYYCSDARYVHVYLNGEFLGPYLLAEQNQINENRVDVYEPEEGYTGTDIGYFVEIDDYREEPNFMMEYESAEVTDIDGTTRAFRPASYTVKNDVYDESQVDHIANYLRGVFRIVYEACEKDNYLTFDEDYNVVPSSYHSAREAVEAVIDVRSFVDMYILYEIMHDGDVGVGSFFMCADFSAESKYPKLTFTAPWDFSWTCDGDTGAYYAAAFCTPTFVDLFGDLSNPWFIVLYKQSWFRDLVRDKWAETGGGAAMSACIEDESAILHANREDLNRNWDDAVTQAAYSLDWLTLRLAWLDGEWAN